MSKIYVVTGMTCEYSDHSEWAVIAYTNEAVAQRHAELAAERADEISAKLQRQGVLWEEEDALRKSNEYDPNMETSYTGTRYYIVTVDLSNAMEPSAITSSNADRAAIARARGEER